MINGVPQTEPWIVGPMNYTSRECYVVDPCWDPRGIVAFAASQKMKVVGAFPTHYHFDHAGGAIPPPFVAMVYGPMSKPGARLPGLREMGRDHGAALYCHALERERLAKQCDVGLDELHPLEQGSTLLLGTAGHLEVLHTPGHSSGSVCVRVNTGSPGSDGTRTLSVFTGDTVFPGSCGRLDLPDSDKGAMYDSLQKLRTLADDIQVYPGHAYSGDKSTIGQEKVRGLLRPFSKAEWLSMHG
jgi:glyoxylase-like metal-dependent hydrolase (beta-lactamase superfamily II)